MSMVLIVDDARTDRELMAKVVSACGHVVEFAEDGLQAMAKVKTSRPDLVLLDVVMPTQDGFATCRQLKKDPDTASIPVVLVTSKGAPTDKFWGERQGADGYIVKPYTRDDVARVVGKFIQMQHSE